MARGDPLCTPADVLAIAPDADPARVDAAIPVASALIWAYAPGIPDPPTDPVTMAAAILSAAIATASPATGAGSVVQESLGAYSYRLSEARDTFGALIIDGVVATLLAPWHSGAYDLSTLGEDAGWPADWFQRDLDTPENRVEPLPGPPILEASG